MGLRNTLAETYFTDDSFMNSLKFDFWQTFDLCSKVTHPLLPADVFQMYNIKGPVCQIQIFLSTEFGNKCDKYAFIFHDCLSLLKSGSNPI